MLSTVLSDTRMCRKRGFGWALWSVKTDCTVYTLRESPPLLFSPITLQVTSHSSPILTSIVSLSMKKSSKFKGLQTNSPLHLSGGNLSTLEIQKSSGSLTSRKGERVALLKTLQSQVSHGFGVLDTDAPRLQCHLCHWMQLPRPGVCL